MKSIIKAIITIPLCWAIIIAQAHANDIKNIITDINKQKGGSGFSETELNNLETIFLAADENGSELSELFAAIAGFETGGKYDIGAVNKKTGCYGLMQLMKRCHKQPMIDSGLDWDDPADQIRWAKIMVEGSLKKGKSLYMAISPWTVRSTAWKVYRKYKDRK
jgi:hypothetical protein